VAKVAVTAVREIRVAVESIRRGNRLLLAVSGGCDSMVLLDAFMRWRPDAIAGVATFDHGTGAFARDAVELVRRITKTHDVRFVHGAASNLAATEAAWRRARWEFLRETAARLDARVSTGHTRDDHVETVFIRLLRDSGPRGLAGLLADGDIVRPLLTIPRAFNADYAETQRVEYLDDPSNLSRRHLRNRVRLDLLPACEAVCPGFSADLLKISERAALWRREVERLVTSLEPWHENRSVFVEADAILAYDRDARAMLWPALAARAGIALDKRGTVRVAAFSTAEGRVGRIQLAGGHEIIRRSRTFEIRPAAT
jgi:tRNA(Ile)-lysidine synthase